MRNKIKIILLDNTEVEFDYDRKTLGQTLLNKVCDYLQLIEKDYFSLAFATKAEEARDWINNEKPVYKQMKNHSLGPNAKLYFEVKFYPPDPVQLQEDITRYLVCLQVRRDLLSGRLPCSFVTHAQLGSYMVQSDIGDFDPDSHGPDYLSELQFAPQQTQDLELKVAEMHRQHKGQTSAEADLHYLEIAKKLAMYGVDLHPARDSSGIDIFMGVCASGLLVYRAGLRINRFAWPKILKISYKRNHFYIRIRPGDFDHEESTIGFKLTSMRAAKRLWKACVEHHTFFRLMTPEEPTKTRISLPRFGSRFRYSGRTQYQSRQASMQIKRPPPEFQRTLSTRNWASKAIENGRSLDRSSRTLYGRNADIDVNSVQSQQTYPAYDDTDRTGRSSRQDRTLSGANAMSYNSITTPGSVSPSLTEESISEKKPAHRRPVGGVAVLPPMELKKMGDQRKNSADRESQDRLDRGHDGLPKTNGAIQQSRLSVYDNVDNRRSYNNNRYSMNEEQIQDEKTSLEQTRPKSKSKEQVSDAKQSFFDQDSQSSRPKSGYTREYSYNVDSEALRHSGQSDPRGLGFSYERSAAPSVQANRSAPHQQKGTALAFTYNPPGLSKSDSQEKIRTIQKQTSSRYGQTRLVQHPSETSLSKSQKQQTPPRNEAVQSNIDEPSDVSSASKESMVDEYARESLRQKTSALISSSRPTTQQQTKPHVYKSPSGAYTTSSREHPVPKPPRTKTTDIDQHYRSPKQSSFWGDDAEMTSSTRMAPELSSSVERREADRRGLAYSPHGSSHEIDENINPNYYDPKFRSHSPGFTSSIPDRGDTKFSPQVKESSKTASQTLSTKTTSHKTDHEDLSRPDEGIVHKKKVDTTVEQEKTTRKQTEVRNMVLTGKYEDIAPIIQSQLAKYGASPSAIADFKQSASSQSNTPYVSSETRKVAYRDATPESRSYHRNSRELEDSRIAPPRSFADQSVIVERNGDDINDDIDMHDQSVSSKTRTVETLTFKSEKDGMVETRVEHKITIKSDGDQQDHDRALANAIQEATMMDPKMTVQNIEITQQAHLN